MNCIAADIGGTNTRFVLVNTENSDILHEVQYCSRDFDHFETMLNAFIKDCCADHDNIKDSIGSLSLAFPGIVTESAATLTNLPWVIEKDSLLKEFNIDSVYFINDFEASAMGLPALEEKDTVILNQGVPRKGATRVVTGAGTGLGLAWTQGTEEGVSIYSTEGGHVDFAPVNETQISLLSFLMKRHGHVSYERILSGDGLVALYEFSSGQPDSGVSAAEVSQKAQENNEPAVQAMTLFTQIYGAYIGNLALLFKPEGGIYITGGIGLKIRAWMESEHFMRSYRDKGRMTALVDKIPVYLVINDRVGVLGAARRYTG